MKSKGIDEVYQLRGGIHRYLEEYPNGLFQGKNFVFDQRVSMTGENATESACVGKCCECGCACDDILPSTVCVVCRDAVVACAKCRSECKGVYHCDAHAALRGAYFAFIDHFTTEELQRQLEALQQLLLRYNGTHDKNRRRTLRKQMQRLQERIQVGTQPICGDPFD